MKYKYAFYKDMLGKTVELSMLDLDVMSAYKEVIAVSGEKLCIDVFNKLICNMAGEKHAFYNLNIEDRDDSLFVDASKGVTLVIDSYDDFAWLEPLIMFIANGLSNYVRTSIVQDIKRDYPTGVLFENNGYSLLINIRIFPLSFDNVRREEFKGFVLRKYKGCL